MLYSYKKIIIHLRAKNIGYFFRKYFLILCNIIFIEKTYPKTIFD